jgi:4-hydroxy-2-oxoheptanedioate aldolase
MLRISAKARLAEKGFLTGPFVETQSPELVEALGLAGFEIAILDCEHSALSGEQVGRLIRAATVAGVAPLVRVRKNDAGHILEALDLGAVGLHVPQISTASDAEQAVRAVRFAPQGDRGFNPFVRAGRYGSLPVAELRREAVEDTLVVLHIEAEGALGEIDAIPSVEGVDVAFLGPYDLSQTLGVPGEVTHPSVLEALRSIARAASARGVTVGCFAKNPDEAALWMREGVRYLAYSVDAHLYLEAVRRARGEIERARP